MKIIYFLIIPLFLFSCKGKKKDEAFADSPKKGTINISVDESFRPVIEEQIKMYETDYPDTKINAQYKPEAACLRDFFNDSTNRMIIITRDLIPSEDRYFRDSVGYFPSSGLLATDAVTILVNKESNDTLFTLERLRDQLLGKINRQQTIVFDGLNATSTVRFIVDSVLKGKMFDTSVVKAAASSNEAIDYVIKNKNAIGLVGINWIGNPEVAAQVKKMESLKMGYVRCEVCEGTPFVKPVKESIISRRYPLVRGLYFILKENYTGLGTGFSSFMKFERGQLIFKRAYLGTAMDFNIRNVNVNTKLPGQ